MLLLLLILLLLLLMMSQLGEKEVICICIRYRLLNIGKLWENMS